MTARWWGRFRVARRTAIGLTILGLLAAVCVYGAVWRASWILQRLLHDWAVRTVAQQSDGVYQLGLGAVHFNWALRRVAVDSISLTTRRAVNARRPQSLPGLHLALANCTLSGVHLVTLVRSAGLVASSFGCGQGSLVFEMPRGGRDVGPVQPGPAPPGRRFGERRTFLVLQQGVRLPSYAPRVQIGRVVFPRLGLDVRLPRKASGEVRLELERLQWRMADVVIDPADTTAATRFLFSRSIELVASNFITRLDSAIPVHAGLLRASLTDSTVDVRDIEFASTGSRAEFTRSRRARGDLIDLAVGHITAQGIDFGAFIVGEGVRARRIEVDSLRIDVTSHKRLPADTPGPPRRTPQQWIADLDETLSLDSLRVRNGAVVYREHAAERAEHGVFTFARIEATAANVSHFVGRRTSEDPMTLTARAYVQNAGQLDVRFVVPLDAPRFNMTVRGTLGAMPASALNPFLVEIEAVQIERGQVAGVAFNVGVRNGVATGTITPRYNDLSVSVTRSGSEGILGDGGILGGAARWIATFAAKQMLRANNPDSPEDAPHIGTIGHTFTPDETLIAFLWLSVRDGLLMAVKK